MTKTGNMKPMKFRCLFGKTIEQRYHSMGYVFIFPWIIGLLWFFVYPMIQAVIYVFNKADLTENGLELTYVGSDILNRVFFEDPKNIRIIVSSMQTTFLNSFLIVVFSLIVAVLLNKPFRGRGLCRAIVALPIIVSSGVLMQVFKEDLFRTSIESTANATIFQGIVIEKSLAEWGVSEGIISWLTNMVSSMLDLIWQSGIQILLFIGAMQSIPKTYIDVCDVEGASAWQSFWKVTFPMITPFLLLNYIYAVIDSFTNAANPVVGKINEYFKSLNYSYGTALSMAYFILVLLLAIIIIGVISKKVFYIEK